MNDMYQPILWKNTRLFSDVDFISPGKRFGDVQLKYSDNRTALGCLPIPVGVVVNGVGPTVLLIGGVHGDEFEGPIALLNFLQEIELHEIQGRIIVFPALNAPAVYNSARVSPVDGGNLNRAFPGNPDTSPTFMIADFVEKAVMPVCNAVLDMHSGGKAAWFSPISMALVDQNESVSELNVDYAKRFGTPLVWIMGGLNDDRTVNFAARRNGIPMISVELGGGGQVTPETLQYGKQGIRNFLRCIGILGGEIPEVPGNQTLIEIVDAKQHVYSPHQGLFEPTFSPGDFIEENQLLGLVHNLQHIGEAAVVIRSPVEGIAFVRCHRGYVERGELLALVGRICRQ